MSAAISQRIEAIHLDQELFRRALMALANPGSIEQAPTAAAAPETAFNGNPWTARLLTMLVDHEVSIGIAPAPDANRLTEYVSRRTRASLLPVDRADFVVADHEHLDGELPAALKRGSLAYPDDAATLIVQVPALGPSASGIELRLSGPGINGERTLRIAGLALAFIDARNRAVRAYPLGIDLILIDQEGKMAALPRTTQVAVVNESGA